MSIKLELYKLVKNTLKNIEISPGVKLFQFVGHYNGQEKENPNNFSYKTPAAFIGLNQINWIHTKHKTPGVNLTREQDGMTQFSLHYFLHDLRTDSDSFEDHLEIVDLCYQNLLGLRSDSSINGKISSLRRISEFDDMDNNNLRHWITFYETRLQEPAELTNKVDAQPVNFILNPVKVEGFYFVALSDFNDLAYNNFDAKIKTNG